MPFTQLGRKNSDFPLPKRFALILLRDDKRAPSINIGESKQVALNYV